MYGFPKPLSVREVEQLSDILLPEIPHIHIIKGGVKKHCYGDLHIVHETEKETGIVRIYEGSGYAMRLLVEKDGDKYTAMNTVSPVLYGVFQFLQEVTNRHSGHPLLHDAVGRSIIEAQPGKCFRCSRYSETFEDVKA